MVFQLLIDKWWLFVLRGVVAILFGILAIVRPDVALSAVVALYGFFALTDGLVSLAGCFVFSKTKLVWWLLLEGLFGIAAGVVTLVMPGLTTLVLLGFLGAWLIASGAVRIALAIQMRKVIEGEWLAVLAGVCSIVAGVLTFVSPLQTAVAWMWVMAAYAFVVGAVMLSLGFSLRRLGGTRPQGTKAA
ncbi:MAG: HdeD family acid-resistance protein [Fimbriimonadaceae bacterium]|nr:HdeD family acid-resistance protein [Fimbriimonadaceae bacterium]QYK54964.1 MAG: HdeD family acid-resistance protein [Fimbriimonadaceae bacterium]